MDNIKRWFIAIGAALSSWLGLLYVPMIVLILCNISLLYTSYAADD